MDNPDNMLLEPAQNDFVNLLRTYYEKLSDKNVLTILWNQMTNKELVNTHEAELTEYRSHLPADLRKYLSLLELKCLEIPNENLQLLDGTYKTYLITFLFFCTKQNGTVTDKTKFIALTLYLKLTMLPEVGKLFFNKYMYMCQMSAAADIIRSFDLHSDQKETVIKLIKQHCLREEHLDNALLAASTNVIVVSMIIGASEEMIRSGIATGLTACCMKTLRVIILHTSSHTLIKIITQRLYRCTKKRYLDIIPNRDIAVDIIILFLKGTLQIKAFDRKMSSFLDGFGENWASEEFTNFKDAVKIMNVFPEEYYKDLLRKMVTLTEPDSKKTLLINVFNLVREIFTTPPNFSFEKITVLYSCTVGNVLHHILNSDEQVVSTAIDVFKEICDATHNTLHQYIFAEIRANGKLVDMPVESVVLGISRAAHLTWSSRNKKLFQILSRFICLVPNLNPVIVEKAIDGIVSDATPRTFHSSLETLQVCYLAAAERGEVQIAELLLHVVHKFVFYPNDNFYFSYASHIFNGLLKPTIMNGKTYSPKYYYSVYLTPSFDYEALFAKCSNQIREHEVHQAIRNLDCREPSSGILLCCLLEYCSYTNTNTLVPYIVDNFSDLSGQMTAGYVCTALEKILKNRVVSNQTHPQLDAIQNAIMSGLFDQAFPIQSIKPIFSLYKTIRMILRLPEDVAQLDELLCYTARKVLRRLHDRGLDDNGSVLYLNEICLILNKIPTDPILLIFQNCLDSPTRLPIIKSFMPDTYIQTLTLLCTIAMVNKSKVSIPMKYLQQNLNSGDNITKVLTIKLMYSLCREITHEFDVAIKFAFKEMVTGNPCLIRICAGILEELIHEDYIKVTSEEFFRIVYVLSCNDLKIFMKDLLLKRFVLSNQNDITKFYLPTIMYMNMYGKLPSYPISPAFYEDLGIMKLKINTPLELLEFLFLPLPIHKKFNIIVEISTIFEAVIKGQCKFDDNFFNVLKDLLTTVKFMKTSVTDKQTPKHYHQNIMKIVEKQIIRCDPNYNKEVYYKEFETEIKRCTLVLFKLLFFENSLLASKIQTHLFDALIHWIDFIKAEIIDYIHEERGKDYDPYFAKLVQFYKKNKNMFDTLAR